MLALGQAACKSQAHENNHRNAYRAHWAIEVFFKELKQTFYSLTGGGMKGLGAGSAANFWCPALTVEINTRMMEPCSGRDGEIVQTDGRGHARPAITAFSHVRRS